MVNGGGGDAAGALAGRVALLTGATSLIGAATARALTVAGARVAIADVLPASPHLDALAAQIRETGGQALPVPAVFDTRVGTRALVRRVVDAWGRLDILVVADGYDAAAGLPSDGASALPRLGQPHPALRGLLHAATAVLPQMERQGGGDIVAVAPVAGGATDFCERAARHSGNGRSARAARDGQRRGGGSRGWVGRRIRVAVARRGRQRQRPVAGVGWREHDAGSGRAGTASGAAAAGAAARRRPTVPSGGGHAGSRRLAPPGRSSASHSLSRAPR